MCSSHVYAWQYSLPLTSTTTNATLVHEAQSKNSLHEIGCCCIFMGREGELGLVLIGQITVRNRTYKSTEMRKHHVRRCGSGLFHSISIPIVLPPDSVSLHAGSVPRLFSGGESGTTPFPIQSRVNYSPLNISITDCSG